MRKLLTINCLLIYNNIVLIKVLNGWDHIQSDVSVNKFGAIIFPKLLTRTSEACDSSQVSLARR